MYFMDPIDCRRGHTGAEQPGVAIRESMLPERELCNAIGAMHPKLASSLHYGSILERIEACIQACVKEQSREETWIYLRISHQDHNMYSRIIQADILPVIAELERALPVHAWWWLSKQDTTGTAMRLRIAVAAADAPQAEKLLADDLRRKAYDVRSLRYEPEMRLFGGAVGMKLAHEVFFRDSQFLALWAQCQEQPQYPFIPIGLMLALMVHMVREAGLDTFEIWDVFEQLSCARPLHAENDSDGYRNYQEMAAKVIRRGPKPVFALYSEQQAGTRKAQLLATYVAQLGQCARSMSRAYFSGELECGLREYLVPIMIFQMNRAGFPWVAQTRLANAAAAEFRQLLKRTGREN